MVTVRSLTIVPGGNEISSFLRAAKQLAGKSEAKEMASSDSSLEPVTRHPTREPLSDVGCAPVPVNLQNQRAK